jgi:hypothetical protein
MDSIEIIIYIFFQAIFFYLIKYKKIYDYEIKHQPNTKLCFLNCDNLIKGATKSIMNQTLWITIIIYNIMSVG